VDAVISKVNELTARSNEADAVVSGIGVVRKPEYSPRACFSDDVQAISLARNKLPGMELHLHLRTASIVTTALGSEPSRRIHLRDRLLHGFVSHQHNIERDDAIAISVGGEVDLQYEGRRMAGGLFDRLDRMFESAAEHQASSDKAQGGEMAAWKQNSPFLNRTL